MKTVVYMGTPDFAVPALEALILSAEYSVKLVVSQPDKPQGRKQLLIPPPVKNVALQYGIEVFQPASLRTDEAYEKISSASPDFIVVAAYGKILPKRILDIPRLGCVNLHGSLLPKYRGAAPIQWSVINGDAVTGVTSMLMNEGMDTGDILFTKELKIGENDTAGEVFSALAGLCPELIISTLDALSDGSVTAVKQNDGEATYVKMLSKEMSFIDWNKSAAAIHNFIRGLNPWPVARTFFGGKLLKIYESKMTSRSSPLPAGSVFTENGEIFAVCGKATVLSVVSLQLEGSKQMSSFDFLRGHAFKNNFNFLTEG